MSAMIYALAIYALGFAAAIAIQLHYDNGPDRIEGLWINAAMWPTYLVAFPLAAIWCLPTLWQIRKRK